MTNPTEPSPAPRFHAIPRLAETSKLYESINSTLSTVKRPNPMERPSAMPTKVPASVKTACIWLRSTMVLSNKIVNEHDHPAEVATLYLTLRPLVLGFLTD